MTESTIYDELERVEEHIYSAMDTACRLLSGALETRVEPVAAKYDAQPSIMEEGQAKELQARTKELAKLRSTIADETTIAASYEIARSLLADLWAVVVEDAQGIPSWISNVVSRAIDRGEIEDCNV